MKYKDISKQALIKYMPATLKWVEKLDSTLNGNEIILRDTDHQYNSLRFEISNYESNNFQNLNKLIQDYTSSHCCICGSTDDVQIEDQDNILLSTFCGQCRAQRGGIYKEIKYRIERSLFLKINPKVRIKFANGNCSYTRLENLNDNISSDSILSYKGEPVYLIGIDLGIRDKNDERVYDGDIVICYKVDGSRFGGMLIDYESYNKRWDGERFMVFHGFGNFPTGLSHAQEFEVIGNIGECSSYDGFGPSEAYFEKWLMENKDRFDSYF